MSFSSNNETKNQNYASRKIYPDNMVLSSDGLSRNQPLNSPNEEAPILDKDFNFERADSLINEFSTRTLDKNIAKNLFLLILQLILDILGLINLVLMTYYRLGFTEKISSYGCFALEIIVALLFMAEIVDSIIKTVYKGLNFSVFLKILSNTLMIFQIIWNLRQDPFLQDSGDVTILINVLRAMRIFCLRTFLAEVMKIYYPEDPENESTSNEITSFVLNNFINLISALFIEATLFLSIDYFLEHKGFLQTEPGNFEYVSALYFSIVNLSTIGYGDISPVSTTTRLVMIAILFFNLSVVSIFLGRLSDLLYDVSPYTKEYNTTNHLIIIGELPFSYLKYFLLELQEIDKIQTKLFGLSSYNSRLKNVLIVNKNKPSAEMEFLLKDQNFYFDIDYLMDNMLNKQWQKATNLEKAKHLLMFSIGSQENENTTTQNDLSLLALAKMIESEYEIKMTLVISGDFEEIIETNKFSENVKIISHRSFNNLIMANSLENNGYNTWLTHLMTLREKKIPFISNQSAAEGNFFRLYEYAKCMTQEIYPLKFPRYFYGKTFQEACKIIYFCRKNMQEKSTQANEIMESPMLLKNKNYLQDFQLLLIGVEENNPIIFKKDRGKMLLNPINYVIKEGDIAYIIAQNRNIAINIFHKFNRKNSIYLQRYQKTSDYYENDPDKEICKNEIKTLFFSLNQKNQTKWEDKSPSSKLVAKKTVYDFNNGESIRGLFSKHVIIKGSMFNFAKIVHILRFYSERPIILFSENEVDSNKWDKLKELYTNIFYVRGMQHNIHHIHELDPQKAYKFLIMSNIESKDLLFQDTDSIVFARILLDFFKINHILLELLDESMIRFLEMKPKFDIMSNHQEISYFWPSFVKGHVHYASLLMSVVARCLYNSNWISFLNELSVPKVYEEEDLKNPGVIKENSTLCMLKITEEVANKVVVYGKLQYLLINSDPCVISLALLKKRKSIKDRLTGEVLKQVTKNSMLRASIVQNNIMQTINSVYGTEFFLTNPPFFTKVAAGDKILVLGNNNLSEKINKDKKTKLDILLIGKLKKMFTKEKNARRSELPAIDDIKIKQKNLDDKLKMKDHFAGIITTMNDTLRKSLNFYSFLEETQQMNMDAN